MEGSPVSVALGVAVIDVEISDTSPLFGPEWASGPYPFSNTNHTATAEARGTYFHRRVSDTLYGTAQTTVRWHRSGGPAERVAELPVSAVEILRVPVFTHPTRGLLIVHADLGTDPIGNLARFRTVGDEKSFSRTVIADLTSRSCTPAPGVHRASTLAYVAFSAEIPDGVYGPEYSSWPAVDQWLQPLALAMTPAEYPPDPEFGRMATIPLSRSWRAMVTRYGAAFVALQPDDGSDPYLASGSPQLYVRSLYLDALLIGKMQLLTLHSIAEKLANRDPAQSTANQLRPIEKRLDDFRINLWWQNVTTEGPANQLLIAFQTEHGLAELRAQIISDLTDSARLHSIEEDERTARAVNAIAAVGLPAGAVLATAPILIEFGFVPALVSFVVAAAISIPIWLAVLHRRREKGAR